MAELLQSGPEQSKLMIAHFVNVAWTGRLFTKWPSHVTALHWFLVDDCDEATRQFVAARDALRMTGLADESYRLDRMRVEVGTDQMVRDVIRPEPFIAAHQVLREAMRAYPMAPEVSNHGPNYVPRVPIGFTRDPGLGLEFKVDGLTLVQSHAPTRNREIITQLEL